MQSWMTLTLHQLLCAHWEIGNAHLRRSRMHRGWRSLHKEWSRRVREVKPTFSAIFRWLRPLEKSPETRQKTADHPNKERALPETRQKTADHPNKERALQRVLESSLRAQHERISAMVAAAVAGAAAAVAAAAAAAAAAASTFTP